MAKQIYLFFIAMIVIQCYGLLADQASTRSKRVIWGQPAVPHSKPWTASIRNEYGDHFCGAFLVNRPPDMFRRVDNGSSDILLTAAHCFVRVEKATYFPIKDVKHLRVAFGKHFKDNMDEKNQLHMKIESVIAHPKYLKKTLDNDIAIIKLVEPIRFTKFVQSIPVAQKFEKPRICTISGWGQFRPQLGEFELSTATLKPGYKLKDNKLIIELAHGYTAPGDSGSALTCLDDDQEVAYGVFSSDNTRTTKSISIFPYLPWINETMSSIDEPGHRKISTRDLLNVHETNDWAMWRKIFQSLFQVLLGGTPEAFNNQRNISHLDSDMIWPSRKIFQRVNITENIYCLHDIFATYVVKDVHACVAICYSSNASLCTYLQRAKRCFLSYGQYDWSYCPSLAGQERSIVFQFNRQPSTSGLKRLFIKDTNSSIKLWRDKLYKPFMISVTEGKIFEHLHCEAALLSTDNIYYDHINISEECIKHLRRRSSTGNFYVEIIVGDKIYHDKFPFRRSKHPTLHGFVTRPLERKIKIHDANFTQLTQTGKLYPTLKGFLPTDGAFFAVGNVALSTVALYQTQCGAVVLNEMEFVGDGREDRSKFILTTKKCVADLEGGDLIGEIGSESKDTRGKYRLRLHYDKHWFSADDDADGLAIIQLRENLIFDAAVQPTLVQGDRGPESDEDIFIAIKYNVQVEVPVKFLDANHTVMERTYKQTQNSEKIKFIGNPVVGCNHGREKCKIYAFACSPRGTIEEYNIPIKPHLEWINMTMNSAFSV